MLNRISHCFNLKLHVTGLILCQTISLNVKSFSREALVNKKVNRALREVMRIKEADFG